MTNLTYRVSTVIVAAATVHAWVWSDSIARSAEAEKGRAPLAELIAAQRKKVEALRGAIAVLRTGPGVYVPSQDALKVYSREQLQSELQKKEYDIALLSTFGFENRYNITVRADVAEKHGLRDISDLADHFRKGGELRSGFNLQFHERRDGYKGLEETYGSKFAPEPELLEIDERYDALSSGRIEITDGFDTDGRLKELIDAGEAVTLQDDREYFGRYRYFAAPLVRAGAIKEHLKLGQTLNELHGKITKKTMTELNYQVEVKGKTARDVAKGFLEATLLIGEDAEREIEKTGTVTVAGKHFAEQDVLCEIMSIMIERKTELSVVRRKRFGNSTECFSALRSGQIDVYAEYTGSAIVACVAQDAMSPWGDEVVLNARVRFAQAELDAFEAAQAFLDECMKLDATAGDDVREALVMQRLAARAISWENRLSDLLGLSIKEEYLADYAEAAEKQCKLVEELVEAISRASDRDGREASLDQQKDAYAKLARSVAEIAKTTFSSDPRSPNDWQEGLRTELAASRRLGARLWSPEGAPTLDAVAATDLTKALEAAEKAAHATRSDFEHAAANLEDQAEIKGLGAESMRTRWKRSLWNAAGAGGVTLFLIGVLWVSLRRRQLRAARRLAVLVVFLVGSAVAALQFETSREIGVAFLASAGVAGVVISIAARSTLANAFAGVMLLLSRPVRIGDTVVIDGERGTIEDMTLMYTAFRTWDNRRVMIPNDLMSDKEVINYSIRDKRIWAKVPIHLDYTADLTRAEEILLEIARASEHASERPESEPVVWPMAMDNQTVLLWVATWADDPEEEWALKCEILGKALARFKGEGVPLPRRRYEHLGRGKDSANVTDGTVG